MAGKAGHFPEVAGAARVGAAEVGRGATVAVVVAVAAGAVATATARCPAPLRSWMMRWSCTAQPATEKTWQR